MSIQKKWTRRKFIRSSAAAATALPLAAKSMRLRAASAPPPTCVFNPEQEEGPYYVDRELLRSDITEGKVGVPLRVRVTVVDAKTCTPIPNAALDVWHCDAEGVYSGYAKINPGGPGGPGGGPGFPGGRPPGPPPNGAAGGDDMPPGPPPNGGQGGPGGGPGRGFPGGMPPKPHTTDDLVFLRGVQITDAQGVVEFKTIYPGHYPGRVNHIHMKVHVGGGATKATADASHPGVEVYAGGHVAHTGQLFFPEDVSRFVEATHPYSGHKIHRTTLEEDIVFGGQGGAGSVAKLSPVTSTQLSDGYVATLTVAVDPGATPKLVGFGGPGGPR